MIRVIQTKDYEEMSRRAASLVQAQILLKPDAVLGLPAGRTPIGTYEELIRMNRAGMLDFSGVRTVNLDEYMGLAPAHVQSFRYFMDSTLFTRINIDPMNTFVPDGCARDAAKSCEAYDALIRSLGGIDLQLLGIGHNGHIGFNEPDEAFIAGTHVVELTEDTLRAMKTYEGTLRRPIVMEDIDRLVDKPVRKISKFDVKAVDERILAIEEEMQKVRDNIDHIDRFTIDWFKSLKKKYGKDFPRRTELTGFETIAATRVVNNNAKLSANLAEGFVGIGLKRDDGGEFISECSDMSEIIVIRKDGKYIVTKVSDKAFARTCSTWACSTAATPGRSTTSSTARARPPSTTPSVLP